MSLINDAPPEPVQMETDAMQRHAPGIYQCTAENALLLVSPEPDNTYADAQMIEIVLRPLRLRGAYKGAGDQPASLADQALARLGTAAA